jgi:hypothetical protein
MFKLFKSNTDVEIDFEQDVSMVPKIEIVPEPSLSDMLNLVEERLDRIESKIDKLLNE